MNPHLMHLLRFLGALASAIGTVLLVILGIAAFFAVLVGGCWLAGNGFVYWTHATIGSKPGDSIALGLVGLVCVGWTVLIGKWLWDGIQWTRETWRKAGERS